MPETEGARLSNPFTPRPTKAKLPLMRAPAATMSRAKALRRALTPPEARLWKHLRAAAQAELHWRKQHGLGPYVLDFYCAPARLCVEVDGAQHEFTLDRDARRDAFLARQGIETLRVPAEAVRLTPEAVLSHIREAALSRLKR